MILRGDADDDARRRLRGARLRGASSGAFAAMRALSTRNDDPAGASRPFDQGRDGFVIAEGAAVLVLEELGHAERRGARILAEVLRLRRDRRRVPTSRCPRPAARAPCAPPDGRWPRPASTPSEIDLVSAHATSTPEGDPAELAAIRSLLGEHAPRTSASRPPRAPSATRSARPAASAPWPRSWRCATAACRRRSTSSTPTEAVGDLDCTPLVARERDDPRGARQRVRLRRPELGARPPALGRLRPWTSGRRRRRARSARRSTASRRLARARRRSSELEVEAGEAAELIVLIDRRAVLERSGWPSSRSAGGTTIVLRSAAPSAARRRGRRRRRRGQDAPAAPTAEPVDRPPSSWRR